MPPRLRDGPHGRSSPRRPPPVGRLPGRRRTTRRSATRRAGDVVSGSPSSRRCPRLQLPASGAERSPGGGPTDVASGSGSDVLATATGSDGLDPGESCGLRVGHSSRPASDDVPDGCPKRDARSLRRRARSHQARHPVAVPVPTETRPLTSRCRITGRPGIRLTAPQVWGSLAGPPGAWLRGWVSFEVSVESTAPLSVRSRCSCSSRRFEDGQRSTGVPALGRGHDQDPNRSGDLSIAVLHLRRPRRTRRVLPCLRNGRSLLPGAARGCTARRRLRGTAVPPKPAYRRVRSRERLPRRRGARSVLADSS